MRPLVFKCPDSNLRVMTDVRLTEDQQRPARDMTLRIACPCGDYHDFIIADAMTLPKRAEPPAASTFKLRS